MDRRKALAKYGALLHSEKLVIGAGGNISEKDGDFLIIKKKEADMSRAKAEDYVRLSFSEAENELKKEKSLLSSETPLHVASYKSREDIGSIVHVHSPYMIALGEKTSLLESTSYEFDCILEKDVPVIEYIKPGSLELAEAIAGELKKGANAVIMKRHGAVIAGKRIEEAYLRTLALERACIAYLHR